MNSIEWLISELEKVNYHPTEAMVMYAKKLHKKEVIESYCSGNDLIGAEQYYQETFVSKGSGDTLKDYHIVDTNEMVELPKTTSDKWNEYQDWLNEHHEDNLVEITYTEEQVKLAYMQGYNRGVDGNPNQMESYIEQLKQNL